MFKNLFSKKGFNSKTGFFKVEKDSLIEIEELNGKGSINDCIETIGFPTNHIYIVHIFDSDKISCLGFTTLTKNLQFVLAENKETKISFSDVLKAQKKIDWSFEYSDLNIEDILEEGIEMENFDLNFLQTVTNLSNEGGNLYKSEKFGIYFQFENDILISFSSSEWENSSTKWLKDVNEEMVENFKKEANKFQRNEIEAMQEVNAQTNALLNIPEAMGNEYIPLHTKENGNVNLYNLVIVHYTQDCKKDDLLFINKGRYQKIDDNNYKIGSFKFEFGNDNELKNIYE